ncbi:hypothetical protein CAEBREN_12333 [Caenorhabditis brenneri]|uniref:Uncharacterized protein n=1 Tax=Caenorhabditis brenneri TaxID=135651 RepID=G0M9U9_CAEBE|nr:hypothetical protein CAEBREN_12333 [Caenorhabditis brenneri]
MESDNSTVDPEIEELLDNDFPLVAGDHDSIKAKSDTYWGMISGIPDIEYFAGMMFALCVVYLVVYLIHLALFKLRNKRTLAPVSILLARCYLFNERLFSLIQPLIVVFATMKFLFSGFVTYFLLIALPCLIIIVRISTETYILLLALFAVTKYFNHFYSGNVELTTNFWKAGFTVASHMTGLKDLGFVSCGLALFGFYGYELGMEKLILFYTGVYFFVQVLLFASAICYMRMFCGRRKAKLNNSEQILCTQTMVLAVMKLMLVPFIAYLNYTGVMIGTLSAFFVGADIVLVPLVGQLSDILFVCKMPTTEETVQEGINLEEMS